ncbi:retroviral-like aspartic protease family protein [Paenibacillus polymyxa]|uniref:retropepsin-like aspartic protease n=1 Tax=Paenibacillus polymyxa TaxID=1406 RepID=UPI001BE7D13F|nr:retropepsin-like aspartic protease [Paenibacillus polymyxa]MBT2286969.1 retroviral-like aspartic protease family protein [Paenibacillus polymyxa]
MKINYDGQLITTSLTVTFRGRTLKIDDVIIDTGYSHTIISPDVLEEIGVTYETGDSIFEAYGIGGSIPFYTKIMDRIVIGTNSIENIEIDVGILPKDHKGLLGLDILKQQGFIIDLKRLELHK